MKNFWVQRDATIAMWHAEVDPLARDPNALQTLIRSVYEAGARTGMLIPIGFDPEAVMMQRWNEDRTVELFRTRNVRLAAELWWFDRNDSLAHGTVEDLGRLLDSLQPGPHTIYSHNREIEIPPVSLYGVRLEYDANLELKHPHSSIGFSISVNSDIWLPYVVGAAHPKRDLKRFFDNRELASRNAVRLNEFLKSVATLARAAGGTWRLDEDDIARNYRPWLSEDGVSLNGPTPELMSPSETDVEWPRLDG